jgi:DNA-binding CsgD family transcriptional regulator
MSYLERACHFVEFSKRTLAIDELQTAFSAQIRMAGFDRFACINHSDFATGEDPAVLCHSYSSEWVSQYTAEELYKADFVYTRAGKHRLPFSWDEPWLCSTMTSAEKRVRHKARAAGLVYGFTVPIVVPGERLASCSHTSSTGYNTDSLPAIHMMALFFHEGLRRLSKKRRAVPVAPKLTHRQKHILTYVAEGKSTESIAGILGLSRHTIDEHVEAVLQKYAVGSRIQAVVRAVQDGSIAPNF